MARANRSTSIEPQRLLARKLIVAQDLRMPIDIEAVVNSVAEVEVVDFPEIECDGAVLLRSRPRVFVNSRRSAIRQRFTFAHELAHIMIPWHTGDAVCDPFPRLASPGTSGPEGEANTFASEILVPRREIDEGIALNERIDIARRAEVSNAALVWAVADTLSPGHVLVLCRGDLVESVNTSPGSHTPTPWRGHRFEHSDFNAFRQDADDGGKLALGAHRLYWWSLSVPLPRTNAEAQAAELLNEILAGLDSEEDAQRCRRSVAGIIGSANGTTAAAEADELVWIFRQRFVGRRDLRLVVDHENFRDFLWAQAEEMARRKRLGISRRKPKAIRRDHSVTKTAS